MEKQVAHAWIGVELKDKMLLDASKPIIGDVFAFHQKVISSSAAYCAVAELTDYFANLLCCQVPAAAAFEKTINSMFKTCAASAFENIISFKYHLLVLCSCFVLHLSYRLEMPRNAWGNNE